MKAEHVQEWADRELAGERVRAWVPTAPTTGSLDASGDPSGHTFSNQVQDHVLQRGLPAERRIGLLTRFVLVLTDSTLAGATIGGLRPRPKQLLFRHPATGATCQWWDTPDGPTVWRNLVVFLDDGQWLGCATAVKNMGKVPASAAGSDALLAGLGDRAVQIDPHDPPPVPG